jgi:hydrogenase expression/formation protein HypC
MCLGIPGQILDISDLEQMLAIVDIGGVRRPVNIACIIDDDHPVENCIGDWVLVHVGFAMNRIDPDEAQLTLNLLEEMAEVHATMADTDAVLTETSQR